DRVAELHLLLLLVGERQDRVGDHAGEAGGVEDALVEVELPGAGLLGEEAPLQPVREPGDDALQMLELLVEQMAQARQLVAVAQRVGLDDLVGLGGEDAIDRLVVAAASRQHAGTARAAGIVIAGTRHHLAIGVGLAVLLGVVAGAVGGGAVHRGLRAGRGALAAIGLVLAVGLVAL